MNAMAKVYRTRDAAVEMDTILGVNAFDLNRALEIDPNFLGEDAHEHDATVGSLALRIVLVTVLRTQFDLEGLLFGAILRITRTDVWQIALITAVILVLIKLFYKELLYFTFDDAGAQATGLPIQVLNFWPDGGHYSHHRGWYPDSGRDSGGSVDGYPIRHGLFIGKRTPLDDGSRSHPGGQR